MKAGTSMKLKAGMTLNFLPFILVFTVGLLTAAAAEECTQGFSVVAPEVAVPGKTTAVLLTLHGAARDPVNATVRLVSDKVEEVTQLVAETTVEIQGHGIVPLAIPQEAVGSSLLQVMVNCSNDGDDCALQSSSELRLIGSVRDVIIRPAKKRYHPGDTVLFWILALDHNLQLASDVTASVCIRDPSGTKVAIWEEISLDEGVKSFSLPLSDAAVTGKWKIEVNVEAATFSTSINVTNADLDDDVPEIPMAEEHYVELKFGKEMRRLYKPGLPFVGKVEAVSTEKSLRVRVKVYDNTTAIYSQDIEISSGEGTFVVPAILADSDVITLQAELVSVEGKEIDSHYVLAREPIKKWNSSSDCYILIEGVEQTLQPDEEAYAVILSTCPCERDIHYIITTNGHVTYWKEHRVPDDKSDDPPTQQVDGAAICRVNLSFTVQSIMAPVSHLLVYYITEDGEPISDVISFEVKLLLKQVSLSIEQKKFWYASEPMEVQVTAEPSSLVCLIGGRVGPEGKPEAKRLERHGARGRYAANSDLDFMEAGISFFQRKCVAGKSGAYIVTYRQDGGMANNKYQSVARETGLEELWVWKCFNYSSDLAAEGASLSAPEGAGKWTLWALTLSPETGLRFSSPLSIEVFRPLQVDFKLPPSLKVGEVVEVDVKIVNNINSCMDITALLALAEGAHFLSNRVLYLTEKLRLGPHGATSLVVKVVVTRPIFCHS